MTLWTGSESRECARYPSPDVSSELPVAVKPSHACATSGSHAALLMHPRE